MQSGRRLSELVNVQPSRNGSLVKCCAFATSIPHSRAAPPDLSQNSVQKVVAGCEDGTVAVFNCSTPLDILRFQASLPIVAVALRIRDNVGTLVAADSNSTFYVIELRQALQLIGQIKSDDKAQGVHSIQIHERQPLFCVGFATGYAKIFDIRALKAKQGYTVPQIDNARVPIRCAEMSPGLPLLLVVGDESGRLFAWDAGNEGRALEGWQSRHRGPITSLCFHNDCTTLISSSGDSTLAKYKIDTNPSGSPVISFVSQSAPDRSPIYIVRHAADDCVVSLTSDGIKTWNADTLECLDYCDADWGVPCDFAYNSKAIEGAALTRQGPIVQAWILRLKKFNSGGRQIGGDDDSQESYVDSPSNGGHRGSSLPDPAVSKSPQIYGNPQHPGQPPSQQPPQYDHYHPRNPYESNLSLINMDEDIDAVLRDHHTVCRELRLRNESVSY